MPSPETPAATIVTWFCAACQQYLQSNLFLDGGIDGYGEIQVCQSCWDSLQPFERLLLHTLSRPTFEGGLNPKTDLAAIERLLECGRH